MKVWFPLIVMIFLVTLPFTINNVWAVTTVTWDTATHAISDGRADSVGIPLPKYTVTDSSLSGNGRLDVIHVLVNSTTDPSGIIQTINETSGGGDVGTFINTGIIFSNGTGLFDIASKQTVGVNYPSLAGTGEIISCHTFACPHSLDVFSTTDPVGIVMNLTETGHSTGVFTNTLHFTTGPSVDGSSISVHGSDIVTIHDRFNDDASNEIVTPNPDPSLGAIPSKYGDTVCAIYNGVKDCTILNGGSAPGGGGGGLVQPGLVLDLVAAVNGIFSDVVDPPSIGNDYHNKYPGGITIDGKPFDISNYATTIPAQILKLGKPATFDFKIFDERGGYTISHVGMYFHFKGDPAVVNADTWISWDKYHGIDLHDPNKIFSKKSVDEKTSGKYALVDFSLTPQKTMPDSSLIMRMWDDKRASGDVPIWGAIVIVDPNSPIPVKKIPTDQYGDYVTLEKYLDHDGYRVPTLLNKYHSLEASYNSIDINWVYDKGVNKLTMVESDKSGNILGKTVCDLFKKEPEPTITARNYVYIPVQLNRWNDVQENAAKLVEADKAEKLLESLGIVQQSNFESLK